MFTLEACGVEEKVPREKYGDAEGITVSGGDAMSAEDFKGIADGKHGERLLFALRPWRGQRGPSLTEHHANMKYSPSPC